MEIPRQGWRPAPPLSLFPQYQRLIPALLGTITCDGTNHSFRQRGVPNGRGSANLRAAIAIRADHRKPASKHDRERVWQLFSHADCAYRHVIASMLARLAVDHHLVVAAAGAEVLFKSFPGALRVQVVAPEARRAGTLMLDFQIERPAALELLHKMEQDEKADRQRKFGKSAARLSDFDLTLNEESLESEQMASIIENAVTAMGRLNKGHCLRARRCKCSFRFGSSREARHCSPGNPKLKRAEFMHPSEEIFANLLDFYRIAWEYEPRSFPVQWDRDGKPLKVLLRIFTYRK